MGYLPKVQSHFSLSVQSNHHTWYTAVEEQIAVNFSFGLLPCNKKIGWAQQFETQSPWRWNWKTINHIYICFSKDDKLLKTKNVLIRENCINLKGSSQLMWTWEHVQVRLFLICTVMKEWMVGRRRFTSSLYFPALCQCVNEKGCARNCYKWWLNIFPMNECVRVCVCFVESRSGNKSEENLSIYNPRL